MTEKTWDWNEKTKYRNFILTHNNYTEADYEKYITATDSSRKPKCTYVAVSKEVGASGTPHLHILMYFKDNKECKVIRNKFRGAWVEPCSPRSTFQQRWEYITKTREGDPGREDISLSSEVEERGERPLSKEAYAQTRKAGGDARGEQVKAEWELTRALAKEGRLEEIDAQHYVVHYNSLKRIAKDSIQKPDPLPIPARKVYFEWWYGPPGAGKSMAAWNTLSEDVGEDMVYDKPPQVKWIGEDCAPTAAWRINDLDLFQSKHLGGLLKTWAEESPFQGEVKGGLQWFRPAKIIVTSNPPPWEIWEDNHTIAAILSRFKIVYWPDTYTPDMRKPDARVDEIHPPWEYTKKENERLQQQREWLDLTNDIDDYVTPDVPPAITGLEDDAPARPILRRCEATKSIWQPDFTNVYDADAERLKIQNWIDDYDKPNCSTATNFIL